MVLANSIGAKGPSKGRRCPRRTRPASQMSWSPGPGRSEPFDTEQTSREWPPGPPKVDQQKAKKMCANLSYLFLNHIFSSGTASLPWIREE